MADIKIPKTLDGVLSDGDTQRSLTVEDRARLAQADASTWEDGLVDSVVELSPDQWCALFDLARDGLALRAERAAVIADLRGLLSRAYPADYVNRTLVVDADSIELLIETLEAANG